MKAVCSVLLLFMAAGSVSAAEDDRFTLIDRMGERFDLRHAIGSGRFLRENFHFGIGRGTIASIDGPRFSGPEENTARRLPPRTPVMGLVLDGEARAYPIDILARHEVANDVIQGIPVAVAY